MVPANVYILGNCTLSEDYATGKKLQELNVHGVIFKPIDMDKVMNLVSN